jgi:pyrimidine operon attenuation protein/uracil phosphoribosyltransferase
VLIGVRTGGYVWAQRLAAALAAIEGAAPPLGALDIALYRDDVTTRIAPEVGASDIRFGIDGARVILVDDVLYTGRTVRAALDALLDFGRPRSVQLAVLVDRGHRELPIAADYVGLTVATTPAERVKAIFGGGATGGDAGDRLVVWTPGEGGAP